MYGEGIASSRGGLVTILSALTTLKELKLLGKRNVGLFFYADEGRGMRYSSPTLHAAAKEAKQVIVMQPGFTGGRVADQRRGSKKYSVIVEGDPLRVGNLSKQLDVLSYFIQQAEKLKEIGSPDKKLTVAVQDVQSDRYSVLLPHRVHATVYVTYLNEKLASDAERQLREIFKSSSKGMQTYIEKLVERPPLVKKKNNPLIQQLSKISEQWNIPFGTESSLLATAAGEIKNGLPVVCGFAPASKDLYTPNEAIHRQELIQRSLLLAMFLLEQ